MQPGLAKLVFRSCSTTNFCGLRNVRLISTNLTLNNNSSPQTQETASSSSDQQAAKWDLYASLCLERRPIITKDLTPLEKKYKDLLHQYEFELSKKSDHEVRHETDNILLEKIKRGEVDQGSIQTAQDFEDKTLKERQAFQPASRITEADKKNDTKSLQRSLSSHLLLVVNQKLGNDYKWVLPQLKREDGETMRDVADRALSLFCPKINGRVVGSAPWGYYKYKYPKDIQNKNGVTGAKVFFFKAQVLSGEMQLTTENDKNSQPLIKDYSWVTRAELPSVLATEEYFKVISEFLIPEY